MSEPRKLPSTAAEAVARATESFPLEPLVLQALVGGWLIGEGEFKADIETLDEAAAGFCERVGIPVEKWNLFLLSLVDGRGRVLQFAEYLGHQVAELAAMVQAAEKPEETAPAVAAPELVYLDVSEDDYRFTGACVLLSSPMPEWLLGDSIFTWKADVPGSKNETFSIQLVNAENGPCLTGHHRRGARLTGGHKPLRSLTEPFTITSGDRVFSFLLRPDGN